MTIREYREVKVPDEVLSKLEKGATEGVPITLSSAGFFDWLNKLSKEEGWRVVWQAFNFPMLVLERDVSTS